MLYIRLVDFDFTFSVPSVTLWLQIINHSDYGRALDRVVSLHRIIEGKVQIMSVPGENIWYRNTWKIQGHNDIIWISSTCHYKDWLVWKNLLQQWTARSLLVLAVLSLPFIDSCVSQALFSRQLCLSFARQTQNKPQHSSITPTDCYYILLCDLILGLYLQ